jgi:hypothetical protein
VLNHSETLDVFTDLSTPVYRKTVNNNDMENMQIYLKRLGEWAVEKAMVVNPAKRKAVCFTRARVTEQLSYSLRDIVIPEASNCKYLGIILRSDLSWADQDNYTVKKAWKAAAAAAAVGQLTVGYNLRLKLSSWQNR